MAKEDQSALLPGAVAELPESPPPATQAHNPPRAVPRPHGVESAHGTRVDPYFWLRDDTRTDPEVLAHLRAENAYTHQVLEPAQPLIEEIYAEVTARLKQDDASVPVQHRGYWYSSRYLPGLEYPLWVRRADGSAGEQIGAEAVMLDCNALAAGRSFFQLGSYEVSPDNRLLAYTVDTVGRRQYSLVIKDLASGESFADAIHNVEPDIAWADGNTLLYVEKDPVTLLGRRVRSHRLGAPSNTDELLYEEQDESFDLTVRRSKSEVFLYIIAQSTTSSEWRFARVGEPSLQFQVFLPRSPDHEYQIEHLDACFLVLTNWQARNFRLMSVTIGEASDRSRWQELVAHSQEVFLHDFVVFREFLAISERAEGLRKIRIRYWNGDSHYLTAADPAYTMYLGENPEMDGSDLRYVYSSLTTPASTYDYNVHRRSHTLLKREPVLGQFDPADYVSEFVWVAARDGQRIPVSVVRRREVLLDGAAPLLLYAYGSYGICVDPQFSSARLSLLDRGFIYAIAHVRGGQELGRYGYDDGRLLNKWNTFHDFIDTTDFLVAAGYGAPDRVFASGGSAGGLLVGVIMNVASQKYAGIVANVPFVDVVTTMLDETIPLTTLEYDEWGNPHERQFYDYMLSYSPYDNVRAQPYAPLLATTGLWDSQVQYYEPAKWVAKLRALSTGTGPLLLHINMEAGHGGRSGRYQRMREIAREYGFIIHLADRGDEK